MANTNIPEAEAWLMKAMQDFKEKDPSPYLGKPIPVPGKASTQTHVSPWPTAFYKGKKVEPKKPAPGTSTEKLVKVHNWDPSLSGVSGPNLIAKVSDPNWARDPAARTLRTAKARSLHMLQGSRAREWGLGRPEGVQIFPVPGYFRTHHVEFPVFARPCPTRPRHGFVESREVRNWGEVADLFVKVMKQDPDGEIILMPRLSALWSGVANNAGVTWGMGNDGVTDANGPTYFIPTPTVKADRWNRRLSQKEFYQDYGPDNIIKDTAYLELVEDDGSATVVQVRDGPAGVATTNWVPRAFGTEGARRLTKYSDMDLLVWEGLVAEFAQNHPEGWVHLPGAPLSSHWAVHAIEHGLAVITDLKPKDHYEPTGDLKPYTLTEHDLREIRSWILTYGGMSNFLGNRFRRRRAAAATAVGVNHAQAFWDAAPHLIRLRAMGVVLMGRLAVAGCAGEIRHWYNDGPGRRNRELEPSTPENVFRETTPWTRTLHRNEIQHNFISAPNDWTMYEALLETITKDFLHPEGWRPNFGGPAWANVSEATSEFSKAVRAFLEVPSGTNWAAVTSTMDILTNTVHNNGSVFTKWIDTMDDFAQCPGVGFMNAVAAEVTLNLISEKYDGQASTDEEE